MLVFFFFFLSPVHERGASQRARIKEYGFRSPSSARSNVLSRKRLTASHRPIRALEHFISYIHCGKGYSTMFRTASKATMSLSLRPYHVPKTKIAAFSCFRQWPISRFFDLLKAQANI